METKTELCTFRYAQTIRRERRYDMNDLIFINNLEDNQLRHVNRTTVAPPSQSAGTKETGPDTYAPGATSCSVHAVNSGSTFGLWRLIFRLFGSD